jgi:hypothetical protein
MLLLVSLSLFLNSFAVERGKWREIFVFPSPSSLTSRRRKESNGGNVIEIKARSDF